MARQISLVQQVQIASPCPASWEAMTGDDKVRFCHQCKLNVYNLSAMTEEEGERLIHEREGRICARIYRRTDGTILTQNCPVGFAALKRKARFVLSKIAAALVLFAGGITFAKVDLSRSSRRNSLAQLEPIASINRWLNPTPPPAFSGWTGGVVNAYSSSGLGLVTKLGELDAKGRSPDESAEVPGTQMADRN